MEINPDTFCAATWFQVRNRQDMTKTVCCQLDWTTKDLGTEKLTPMEYMNSPKIINMRKQLSQGKKIKECSVCWRNESNGVLSLRQAVNEQLLRGGWSELYFNKKDNYETDMILIADVKIGNTCNFACIMCNAQDSSKIYADWMANKDSEFVEDYLKEDSMYLEKSKSTGYKTNLYRKHINDLIANNKHILSIKMLGGEPLMDKNLLQILSDMPSSRKKKIHLQFVTNGSHNLKQTTELLGNFKKIEYHVSLEGVGTMQEYARYGANWSQIESHILEQEEYMNGSIQVQHVMQASTVCKLHELINWVGENNIEFSVNNLFSPSYLSLQVVPNKLKPVIIKHLQNVKPFAIVQSTEYTPYSINAIIDTIEKIVFNKTNFDRYKKYINFYERDKVLPAFVDVCPEWKEYFDEV